MKITIVNIFIFTKKECKLYLQNILRNLNCSQGHSSVPMTANISNTRSEQEVTGVWRQKQGSYLAVDRFMKTMGRNKNKRRTYTHAQKIHTHNKEWHFSFSCVFLLQSFSSTVTTSSPYMSRKYFRCTSSQRYNVGLPMDPVRSGRELYLLPQWTNCRCQQTSLHQRTVTEEEKRTSQ